MKTGNWCFYGESSLTFKAPESMKNLYAEFAKAISNYFCVQFSTSEELLYILQNLEVSPGDARFIKWLEDTGFPTFRRLLRTCCISDENTVARLDYELEMLYAFTNDFINYGCDSDTRMDFRAYLINFISYLPDLVETDLSRKFIEWSIEEKPHFLAKKIESANNADSIFFHARRLNANGF